MCRTGVENEIEKGENLHTLTYANSRPANMVFCSQPFKFTDVERFLSSGSIHAWDSNFTTFSISANKPFNRHNICNVFSDAGIH